MQNDSTIRIGIVTDLDLDNGLCHVLTGGNTTDWLHWLTGCAGKVRSCRAPSINEQVLILSLGGELDSAFVLNGILSDDFPAQSASADDQQAAVARPLTLLSEPIVKLL